MLKLGVKRLSGFLLIMRKIALSFDINTLYPSNGWDVTMLEV